MYMIQLFQFLAGKTQQLNQLWIQKFSYQKGAIFAYFSWKFHVYRIKVLNMHPSNQVLLSAVNWNLVAMIKCNPVLFIIFLWKRTLVSCVCSVIPVHLHILCQSRQDFVFKSDSIAFLMQQSNVETAFSTRIGKSFLTALLNKKPVEGWEYFTTEQIQLRVQCPFFLRQLF